MADKSFCFVPKNMRDATSFQDKAISFVNHLSYNLRDGDRVAIYSEYAAITRNDTGKTGLYRADNGIPILCDVFDTIEIRNNNSGIKKYGEYDSKALFFEVSVGDCYGIYSEHGLQLVPVKYKKEIVISDGFFVVTSTDNRCKGVYNKKGTLIVPAEYDSISVKYGIIVAGKEVKLEHKEYAFNRYGRSLFFEQFSSEKIKGYNQIVVYKKCIVARENKLKEVFTIDGSHIIAKKMTEINVYSDYIIARDENGKFGVYDYEGEVIISHEFDRITGFESCYIRAKYGKTECLFYKDGHIVLDRGKYKKITETKKGAIAITLDGTKVNFELRMYNAIRL